MQKAIAIALVATLLPASAGAKEPTVLAQSAKWQISYDDDACNLYTIFGEGDQSILIRFTRYEPGDRFGLTLIGKRLRTFEPKVRFNVDFGIQPAVGWIEGATGTVGKTPMIMAKMRLVAPPQDPDATPAPITPEQEATSHGITLAIPGINRLFLDYKSLAAPMAAMRACTTDLVRHWGFDPEVEAHLSRRATPTNAPGSWLSSDDFPSAAAFMGHNGLVQIRLDVSEAGAVTKCSVLERTNPDDFADITCKQILKRARFTPALDSSGHPVASYFMSSVHWMSP